MASLTLILILSYLVGSIPASVWIGKRMYGVDIREYGSGNAGATNAFRIFGWKAGLAATGVDLGKGLFAAGVIATLRVDALPVLLSTDVFEAVTLVRILAGLAAVVGHILPVWAGFKGGKGVNTSCGVLFAITPTTTIIALGVFAGVLLLSRYVSLASITAAVAFPAAVVIRRYLFHIQGLDESLLIFATVMAIAVVWAHQSNIRRLLNGTETRIRTFRPSPGQLGGGAEK